ncbi:MAG TPA: hypothetical protein VNN08_09070 [Thermoanaerobaculia bacterium]|nr:hypothetical protein [Thermoanaerobaculia bacterium]
MSEYRFSAEVARHVPVTNSNANAAAELWRSATTAMQERVYTTPGGTVRVRADWTPLASEHDVVRIDVQVIDDAGHLAPRDVPSFVELFFHDVFLLFNIALPGSFGGAITVTGGDYRVNDLSFDASAFAYAAVTTAVPLAEVAAWYRGGTEQIAKTPMQKVLFHLLHIARGGSDEWMLRARLMECLEALGMPDPSLSVAGATVIHPMHDEVLDERVDDDSTELIDGAMAKVLVAIQERIRGR